MKSTPTLQFSIQNKTRSLLLPVLTRRLFLLTLVSCVAVATLLGIAASANKANRAAKATTNDGANSQQAKSGSNPVKQIPNAPSAVGVTATLTDNVTPNTTKVAPGATVNYTAVISAAGVSPADDALNAAFNDVLDSNTTYVAGSVHASPIAFNDTYNWVGNTQLDSTARALPAVTANDVAVNATLPAVGTDTFNVITQTNAPTALAGGLVTLNANGSFVYTPPLGRPNIADGVSATDSFTYTIANSADATLVGTGTVNIVLTGRVWYLQAGAAGDGRSNTPSGNPATMSTNADKATDVFYIFSNAGSLSGLFTVDAGQQLLGQAVNLVVNSITLFTAAAPTPTTTNGAGNCVTLAGAPGNNTLSGFNIGNCSGFAIQGANVGTLAVNTLSINTTGGGLDLTGSGNPAVSVVLGGLTSTGGTKNVNLVTLGGTVTLASGALSGASSNAFDVSGGVATISYSGTVTNTAAARLINIASMTGGSVSLSGALSGTGSSTGINLTNNAGATLNFTGGINLSTGASAAFTATGAGPAATTGGTINVTQNNTSIVNTLATTTGAALNVANTTIGASGLTFRSISSSGAANGIIVNNTGTTGSFTITGNGGACTSAGTCTGGAIQNSTGDGVVLTSTQSPSLTRLNVTDSAGGAADDGIVMTNIPGTVTVDNSSIINSPHNGITVDNFNVNMAGFNFSNSTISCASGQPCEPAGSIGNDGLLLVMRGTSVLTSGVISGSTFSGVRAVGVQVQTNDSGRIGTNSGGSITAAMVVQTNTFTGNGQGVDIGTSQVSNLTFQVLSNTINGISTAVSGNGSASAINAFTAAGPDTGPASHTFVGKIDGNSIGTQGTKDSGSGFGNGIRVVVQGQNTQAVVTVSNNTVRECAIASPMNFIGQNGNASAGTLTARFRITNNTLPLPSGTNVDVCGVNLPCIDAGIFILADEGSPVCNVITGNNVFDATAMNGGADIYLAERTGPPAGAQLTVEGTSNAASPAAVTFVDANNTLAGASKTLDEGMNVSTVTPGTCGGFPALPNPVDESVRNQGGVDAFANLVARVESPIPTPIAMAPAVSPAVKQAAQSVLNSPMIGNAVPSHKVNRNEVRLSHHAVRSNANASAISPNLVLAGETINVPFGSGGANGTLPAGKSITIKYAATVNVPPLARQVSTQGTVSGSNFATVQTDDPDAAGSPNPTITLIDTTETWTGSTSTDWNDPTNWTPAFVPSSVSDVIIPNAGVTFEPNIITPDVNVFTLDLQSARTLTINPGRTLTVNGGLTTLAGALAGGPYTLNFVGLTINRAAGITVNGPTSVSGVLTLTSGNVTTGANVLTVGSAGSIVRTSGHIVGSLRKTNVTTGFVFTVGTAVGYTQVDITSAAGGGDLTVTTVDAPQPTLETNNPGKSLTEYWALTEGGTLTASMVFHYLQTDVPGTSTEANYRIIRVMGTTPTSFPLTCPSTSCVDTGANTFTISGVSNFSDWTVGEVLAPTASGGVVTGRIVDDSGNPVEGAVVRLNGAQNRKFITDANGFYRFDNVETNGFYTVTPSRANYSFSPQVRSFTQLGETTEAGFGATLSSSGLVNPLDTPEYYVRQHYLDFLGREPDEAGFNFWSDQILVCGDDNECVERRRVNVSAAYFLSIEFQQTGGLVDGLYRASYGVRPQFGQFMPDTRAVALGVIVGRQGWPEKLETNKQAFIEAFVNRPAFVDLYGTMSADMFVDTLLNNTGVRFTTGERDAWVSSLSTGTATRAEVLRSIAENERFVNAKFNEAFVMMEYFGYLRRDPDASGYAFWLNKLSEFNGNFERAEMVKAFIVSGEFRDRFPR